MSAHLTEVVLTIFSDSLSDLTNVFEEAALSCSVAYNGAAAIVFKFSGFHQKLHLLAETVLGSLQKLEITKQRYEIQKELLQRSIASMKKHGPALSHARYVQHRGKGSGVRAHHL